MESDAQDGRRREVAGRTDTTADDLDADGDEEKRGAGGEGEAGGEATPVPAKKAGGFFERNLATILTFIGALITAYVALTTAILKQSNLPTARLSVTLGDGSIAAVESGTIATQVFVVPVHQKLSFSGAGSGDPESDAVDAHLDWTIVETYPSVRFLMESGSDLPSNEANEQLTWEAPEVGAFQISFTFETKRTCWFFIRCFAKKSSALLHVQARQKEAPLLVVKGTDTSGTGLLNVQIEASSSESFDREAASLLHFVWKLDGRRVSEQPSFPLALSNPQDGPAIRTFVLEGVVTDRWGTQSAPFKRLFAVARPPATKTIDAAGATQTSSQQEPNQKAIQVPEIVDENGPIGSDTQDVVIKGRVITHGHKVTIRARRLVALDASITANDDTPKIGRPGATGAAGAPGVGPGADGRPGGDGQLGSTGSAGVPSQTIDLHVHTFSGNLVINNSGAPGQDGGHGGDGGPGGPGAQGEPARSGFLNCAAGPGRGGTGGPGGDGGVGGPGGDGGGAGTVSLNVASIASGSQIRVDALGGSAGAGGAGGIGGPGGPGGSEGPANGFCGPASRQGSPGPSGAAGAAGPTGHTGRSNTIFLLIGDKAQSVSGSAQIQGGL